MTVLDEYVFEIGGVQFGYGCDLATDDGGFDPGSDDIRNQDTPNPVADSIIGGRDYHTPSSWTWELTSMSDSPESALDAVETLASQWLDDTLRLTPGAFTWLRYGFPGGRQKRVPGRPRRWQAAFDNRMMSGGVPVTCDFQRYDPLHYSDDEFSKLISIIPASIGGLAAPIKAPLTAVDFGVRSGDAVVGGTVPTYPVITINAPQGVVSPYVTSPAWGVYFSGNGGLTVPHGGVLVIDARPWVRSITLNGNGVGGYVKPGFDFASLKLALGANTIAFGGIDPTGTATCTVKWRTASRSL